MTTTAILSPLNRSPIAGTDTGVPRTQKLETTPDNDQDENRPDRTVQADNKPAPNATTRRTTIDWETGSVVFRVIDEHSGQTISQSPEEALLRLRAYARQSETTAATETEKPTPPNNRTAKTV